MGKGSEELFNRYGVSIWDDVRVLEMDSGDGLNNNVNILNATENCITT